MLKKNPYAKGEEKGEKNTKISKIQYKLNY